MAFWIFKCDPEVYRLSDRMADPILTTSWRVRQHRDEIGPGDIAFIWETGANRGIRAVMRVDEVPHEVAELETEQPYYVHRDTEMRLRTRGTFIATNVNLFHEALREVPGLENLAVFRKDVFQQATNFPVTAEEGAILLRLVEGIRA